MKMLLKTENKDNDNNYIAVSVRYFKKGRGYVLDIQPMNIGDTTYTYEPADGFGYMLESATRLSKKKLANYNDSAYLKTLMQEYGVYDRLRNDGYIID